jgi:adenylate cyclase
MSINITLDESTIIAILDAIDAKKNEIYDRMEFGKEKELQKVERVFSKALEDINAQKMMAMEMAAMETKG